MQHNCCIPGCNNKAVWECCGQDGIYDTFFTCDEHVDTFPTEWVSKINKDGDFMHEEIGY